MFNLWLQSLFSVLIISLISLIGVFTFTLRAEKLKKILIYLVSFSAGSLLGNAFLHLLPETIEKNGWSQECALAVLLGIIIYFAIEKFIRFQHCHIPASKTHPHSFSYIILLGDGMHNFIDGLIIGASFMVSSELGWITTLAVILHEIPQEIGDFGSLLYAGFSKNKALFWNFISALSAFLGVILILILGPHFKESMRFLLPFTAGGFIYIATADLMPEMHKQYSFKKSLLQLCVFLLGITIMLLL